MFFENHEEFTREILSKLRLEGFVEVDAYCSHLGLTSFWFNVIEMPFHREEPLCTGWAVFVERYMTNDGGYVCVCMRKKRKIKSGRVYKAV